MKAHYRTPKFTFEVDGEGVKDVFKKVSALQEVFEAESSCGCCGSASIRFQHRKVDKFDYYEMACNDCNARFQFGQAQEGGGLFPKRKAESGAALPNRGWAKWEGKNGNGK